MHSKKRQERIARIKTKSFLSRIKPAPKKVEKKLEEKVEEKLVEKPKTIVRKKKTIRKKVT